MLCGVWGKGLERTGRNMLFDILVSFVDGQISRYCFLIDLRSIAVLFLSEVVYISTRESCILLIVRSGFRISPLGKFCADEHKEMRQLLSIQPHSPLHSRLSTSY